MSTLRRSKRTSYPPERFGFEVSPSNENQEEDELYSLFTLPDGRKKQKIKLFRARVALENELSTDLPDDCKDRMIDAFDEDPEPWMSSDDEDQDPEDLKKNDLVKFLRNGQFVQARVIHVSHKMAQVRINLVGEVMWKAKKNLIFLHH